MVPNIGQEVLSEHERNFIFFIARLSQDAQRGCEILMLGDHQKSSGNGEMVLALGDLV